MADNVIPPQWARLSEEGLQGTVMIIGASDTGKSTLARYLFQELCRRGQRVAYLDVDVGQSTLGEPATLNLALAQEPGDDCLPPQGPVAAYFVGAITPRGHMLPTVIGAHRLQQRALALGAEAIVVDTSGLVDKAQGGKVLKQWKIELLAPRVVVGIQRRNELEPILWPLRRDGRVRCVELAISPYVRQRSREARMARRQKRLATCFAAARPRLISLRQTAVYDIERLTIGGLVGFQDAEGLLVGLGVVDEADQLSGDVVIRTPLPHLEGVASVRFGAARWGLTHRQETGP